MEAYMNIAIVEIAFAITALATVFSLLLSLRKLGQTTTNLALLFAGLGYALAAVAIPFFVVKAICLLTGLFLAIFALVKIIRKM